MVSSALAGRIRYVWRTDKRKFLRLLQVHKWPQLARAAWREARGAPLARSGPWQSDGAFARRLFQSYDEYVLVQKSKLPFVEAKLRRREAAIVDDFHARFALCAGELSGRNVLCLGARLGAEVRAFIRLGFFAIGIDLNPGANNKYVCVGDFHDLQFADGTVDVIYSNAFDHVYDLEKVVREAHRVLAENGTLLLDIFKAEKRPPGPYEALWWQDARALAEQICRIGSFRLVQLRDLAEIGEPQWTQALFRKVPVA
jgi:SAM-dependent methyltransferase